MSFCVSASTHQLAPANSERCLGMHLTSQTQADKISSIAESRMRALLVIAVTFPSLTWVLFAIAATLIPSDSTIGLLAGAAVVCSLAGGLISIVIGMAIIAAALVQARNNRRAEAVPLVQETLEVPHSGASRTEGVPIQRTVAVSDTECELSTKCRPDSVAMPTQQIIRRD